MLHEFDELILVVRRLVDVDAQRHLDGVPGLAPCYAQVRLVQQHAPPHGLQGLRLQRGRQLLHLLQQVGGGVGAAGADAGVHHYLRLLLAQGAVQLARGRLLQNVLRADARGALCAELVVVFRTELCQRAAYAQRVGDGLLSSRRAGCRRRCQRRRP